MKEVIKTIFISEYNAIALILEDFSVIVSVKDGYRSREGILKEIKEFGVHKSTKDRANALFDELDEIAAELKQNK